jgi:hypothetical protein
MRASRIVHLLGLIVLFLLAGVLPSRGGNQAAVFGSPVFMVLLGLLALGAAARCLRPPRRRRLGFLLTHAGVGVLLAGAMVGFAAGRKGQMVAPVDERHAIRQAQIDERTTFDLPFDVTVTRFAVDYYDPDYQLFQPLPAAATNARAAGAEDYRFVRKLTPARDGSLAVPGYGAVKAGELRYGGATGVDSWRRQVALTNEWILQRGRPAARHFEAVLRFGDGGVSGGTAGAERTLRVNHPVSHRGWRFYLMSHGEEGPPYVVLSARRDPGRGLAIAGIWMLIAGTAAMGLARRPPGGGSAAAGGGEGGHAS